MAQAPGPPGGGTPGGPDTWWVLIPQVDAGKPPSYLDKVDFRLQFAPPSSDYYALENRQPINWAGEELVYWQGPFATEADAKAAQNPQPSPEGGIPNPLSGLAAISDFFSRLGQANTWIRIGEVLLGAVLLAIGVARVTHAVPAATQLAKTAGAVGVLA